MAEVLKKYDFPSRTGGFRSVYNWEELLDGQIRKMVKGDDFTCDANSLVMTMRNKCLAAGKRAQIAVEGEEGEETIIFRAVEMTDEEREQRAEASRKRKAAMRVKRSVNAQNESDEAGEGDAQDESGEEETDHVEEEVVPEPEPVKPAPRKGKSR